MVNVNQWNQKYFVNLLFCLYLAVAFFVHLYFVSFPPSLCNTNLLDRWDDIVIFKPSRQRNRILTILYRRDWWNVVGISDTVTKPARPIHTLFLALMLAPALSSAMTTSICPLAAACNNGGTLVYKHTMILTHSPSILASLIWLTLTAFLALMLTFASIGAMTVSAWPFSIALNIRNFCVCRLDPKTGNLGHLPILRMTTSATWLCWTCIAGQHNQMKICSKNKIRYVLHVEMLFEPSPCDYSQPGGGSP